MKQSYDSKMISGRSVALRHENDINGAIRRLKKVIEGEKQSKELMEREYFEKPSVTKQKNKAASRKRTQRERQKRISAGLEKPFIPQTLKYLKSRRSRRRVIDERAAYDMALRNRLKEQPAPGRDDS